MDSPRLSGSVVAASALWALCIAAGFPVSEPTAEGEWTAGATTPVRVHYAPGFGNRIAIRGSAAPLSWNTGRPATWTSGNVWVTSWSAAGDVEVKPLINDAQWSTGGNYRVRAGTTVD